MSVEISLKARLLFRTTCKAGSGERRIVRGARYASATRSLSRYGLRRLRCERHAATAPNRFHGISWNAAEVTGCPSLPQNCSADNFIEASISRVTSWGDKPIGLNVDTPLRTSPPNTPVRRVEDNNRAC